MQYTVACLSALPQLVVVQDVQSNSEMELLTTNVMESRISFLKYFYTNILHMPILLQTYIINEFIQHNVNELQFL
jgi:hypothetical protein